MLPSVGMAYRPHVLALSLLTACAPSPSAPDVPSVDAPVVDGGGVDGGAVDAPLAPGLDAPSAPETDAPASDAPIDAPAMADAGADAGPLPAVHVVVLGSSTAAGKNLDVPMYGGRVGGLVDRWSDRYLAALDAVRPGSTVDNLALPGQATYSVLPDGTVISTTWLPGTGRPDPTRNITRAVSLAPDAIVINMPLGRELSAGESLDTLMANLHTLVDTAAAAGIEVWITTTAAAMDSTAAEIDAFRAANARTTAEFGPRVIDFFPVCSLASGAADPALRLTDTAGHPSAECHQRLADAVLRAGIPEAVLPR